MTRPHSRHLQMSQEEILAIATHREFFVSKYGESHERLRKKCRRMLKDGLLTLMSRNSRGFNYRATAAITDDAEAFALVPDPVEP